MDQTYSARANCRERATAMSKTKNNKKKKRSSSTHYIITHIARRLTGKKTRDLYLCCKAWQTSFGERQQQHEPLTELHCHGFTRAPEKENTQRVASKQIRCMMYDAVVQQENVSRCTPARTITMHRG